MKHASQRFASASVLQMLQVGRTHVEVPQRVRVFGLEADRGRLACHPLVVVAEVPQVAVGGGSGQLARCQLLETIRRIDTMFDQQLQGTDRREMRKRCEPPTWCRLREAGYASPG